MKASFVIILSLLTVSLNYRFATSPRLLAEQTSELSIFYCGFSGEYCGHSSTNDVNSKATIVILSFVNTQADGSVKMDEANFPHTPFSEWKESGKRVLLSVGGEHGNFNTVFSSDSTITNFVTSLVDYVKRYNLDGVDLDLERYDSPPRKVA